MKELLLFTAILFMFSSCTTETELLDPELRIYQTTHIDKNNTIPVKVVDNHDGTGTINGALLHNVGTQTTTFDAVYDYVNADKTNFIMNFQDGAINSIFSSGSGHFTSDSIYILIKLKIAGMTFSDSYRGDR